LCQHPHHQLFGVGRSKMPLRFGGKTSLHPAR
jgi:hypothetical protein